MRIIDNLGIQAPANVLAFSDDNGQPVSEFVDDGAFDGTAGIVCSSVACDNHLAGLLPTDVPEAPAGTVYTKRWFELVDDGATQRFLHLNDQNFSRYFESCTGEVAPARGANALLLGGYSWNGIALALIASRRGFTKLGHLLVAGLYSHSETDVVRDFIEGLGIEIVETQAALSTGAGRVDMLSLVETAAAQKSAGYTVLLNPSSSTQKSANFLATRDGIGLSAVAGSQSVFEGASIREIELFARLNTPVDVAEAIELIQTDVGAKLKPARYDAYMLAAQALEYYFPRL